MWSQYEEIIKSLKQTLKLGTKTAERLFNQLLLDINESEKLVETIQLIKNNFSSCNICFGLSVKNKCVICTDPSRDQTKICVVGTILDLTNIEKTKTFNGLYHVLNGEINLTKGVTPDNLTINQLEKRINDKIVEVIIATSTTFEGEVTAQYIRKRIEQYENLIVSRIAKGLPSGSSFDYADEMTIKKALEGRKKL